MELTRRIEQRGVACFSAGLPHSTPRRVKTNGWRRVRGSLETQQRAERKPKSLSQHAEDLKLVARLLAGDRQAFDAFGYTSSRTLYRFAIARLRDRELTRDIVQTTLTKALAKLETYRGAAALQTWLCSLCLNEIRMHFRRLGRLPKEAALENAEISQPAAGYRPPGLRNQESDLLRNERTQLVHVALEALPERYAKALEWKYLERRSVSEIAQRLDLKLKAAESLLTRARGAFRSAFSELQGIPGSVSVKRSQPTNRMSGVSDAET